MPLPNTKMKIKKDGVIFESNVNAVEYTMRELTIAANRDVGKFIRKRVLEKLRKLRGMKGNKRLWSTMQFWARKIDLDVLVGHKHSSWYSSLGDQGQKGQPKRNILRETVFENISEINKIQAQYLSALNDENPRVEEAPFDGFKSPNGEE